MNERCGNCGYQCDRCPNCGHKEGEKKPEYNPEDYLSLQLKRPVTKGKLDKKD